MLGRKSKQDHLLYLVGALARFSLNVQMHGNRDNNLQRPNLCTYYGSSIHGCIRCYTRVIWFKGVLGELGFAYVDPITLYIDSTSQSRSMISGGWLKEHCGTGARSCCRTCKDVLTKALTLELCQSCSKCHWIEISEKRSYSGGLASTLASWHQHTIMG